ncbi:MAG: YceD family protein [Pseudomonadota bacterium]
MNQLVTFKTEDEWNTYLSTHQLQSSSTFQDLLKLQSPQVLEGSIALSLLPRLRAALAKVTPEHKLSFSWVFEPSARPLPKLKLNIKSIDQPKWQLACQRCLGPITWNLNSESTFWVARNEEHIQEAGLSPDDEAFFYEEPVAVLQYIEDEALLAMPYSPRHAENQCKIAGNAHEHSQNKAHPFAILASLKRKTNES